MQILNNFHSPILRYLENMDHLHEAMGSLSRKPFQFSPTEMATIMSAMTVGERMRTYLQYYNCHQLYTD